MESERHGKREGEGGNMKQSRESTGRDEEM